MKESFRDSYKKLRREEVGGWKEGGWKEESRGQLGRFEGKLKRDSDHVT